MQDNNKERFPIVDEEGRVVGAATRGECHNGSKLLHPVVHLHVFNSRGEVYLQKRPEWKDIQPGKWDTSVGGHIDYGETPEQALVREVGEELGITDFVPERIGMYVFESRRERELVYVHRTIYDGPIRPSAEELDGGRFWSMDEIRAAIGQQILTPNFESEFQRFFLANIKIMKKYLLDLTVKAVERIHERYVLIKLTDGKPLPEMVPGQFVEVRVDGSPSTFLRRPISINFVDREQNELWLLVATVGDGTRKLAELKAGDTLNCLLPLGNGFTTAKQGEKVLLIGGGVGVAPLLYMGAEMQQKGIEPTFLLGARTVRDLLLLDLFKRYGRVFVTTEDGSEGEKGFVTNHSILQSEQFDRISTCGPTPMMKAVARFAKEKDIDCEASLENLMACGLGACLCCVEKVKTSIDQTTPDPSYSGGETTNVCVCKDGPVFNVQRLLW